MSAPLEKTGVSSPIRGRAMASPATRTTATRAEHSGGGVGRRPDRRRRAFLECGGAGLLAFLAPRRAGSAEGEAMPFKAFDRTTRIDVGGRGDEILEQAYRLGHEYEGKHGGCCRCTVAALQKTIEFIPADDDLFRAACCLDGGATGSGVQNCGAFTGAGMIIGYLCGRSAFGDTSLAHALIHSVYERFRNAYGSVLCKDVRDKGRGDCPFIVGTASRWTAEAILRQFTRYGKEG